MFAKMRKIFTDSNIPHSWIKLLFTAVACMVLISLTGCKAAESIGMLNPKGLIAYQERKLFFDTLALMLIVVLPVIIMSITFVYHYQVSHRTRDYKPHWSHNVYLEMIWWGIPCVIILVLAIMTWQKSHSLDPFRRIQGDDPKPLLIQAIALPWKWLFIYPEQNIATVNYLELPVNQQVEYWITADNVPMSAFMIPQLGSQIYAMAGMRSRLHLLANHIGNYTGLNTQYNGNGFSDMHFQVHVVKPEEMQNWISQVQTSSNSLTAAAYSQLLNPSFANTPTFFSGLQQNLFDNVVNTYMMSTGAEHPREKTNKFNQN